MTQQSRGFTLIELMIVIAIVGILASIAMPSYRDYIRKSEMAEVVTLGNALAGKVIAYYNVHGVWPDIDTNTMEAAIGTGERTDLGNGDNIVLGVVHGYNGNGQVFFLLKGESWGGSSDDWVRLNLIDDGTMIRKEWCDTGGVEPTNSGMYPYLPC